MSARLLRFVSLGMLCLVSSSCFEKVEESYELGYKGEARRNAFLAASRIYEAYGYETHYSMSLKDLPSTDSVLFMPAASITTTSRAQRLIQWIEDGGHLVYMLNSASYLSWQDEGENSLEPDVVDHPVLEAFNIGFGRVLSTEVHDFSLGEYELAVEFPSSATFDISETLDTKGFVGDNASETVLAHIGAGWGALTVINNVYPLRNRAIDERDNADFALALADLNGSSEVWFVYASDLSFFGMLWEKLWMALLGLLVLLLLWLWKVIPRFGPLYPPAAVLPRHFTSHLLMTAQFLWRHGRPETLLDPVRRRLVKHYQTRTGRSLPAFSDADLHAYLVEHSGFSLERVQAAMISNPVKDSNGFTRLIQDLNVLETSL